MKALKVVLPAAAALVALAVAARRPPAVHRPPVLPRAVAPAIPEAAIPASQPPAAPGNAATSPSPVSRERIAVILAGIEALPVSSSRSKQLRTLMADWARVDPWGAAAWTRTLPRVWNYTNPDGSRCSETARLVLREILARTWASLDPATAAVWVEALASEEGRDFSPSIAGAVAEEWVKLNAQAAARWAAQVQEENRGFTVSLSVYGAWASTNPREAVDWLERHATMRDYPQIVKHFATQWALTQPRDAAAWATTLGPPVDRKELFGSIARMWSITDADAAATWAASLPADDQSDALIRDIGQSLSSKNPEFAARWADHFPEGPRRSTALLATVATWATRDPEGAISFLHRLPSEPRRNEEMLKVGRRLLAVHPSAGPALLRQMQMPTGPFDDRAEPALERLFKAWSKVDPDSAVAWAEETSTTPGGRSLKEVMNEER